MVGQNVAEAVGATSSEGFPSLIIVCLDEDMVPTWSLAATTVLLTAMLAVSTAQQRFQFCGGPGLIHAVIRVCSRSLPDELAPPTERPTTTAGIRLTKWL